MNERSAPAAMSPANIIFHPVRLRIIRVAIRRKGSCDEALGFALGIGAFLSMASLIAASKVGELAALRLHASESLLLIGAAIILVIDTEPAVMRVPEEAAVPSPSYLPAGTPQ